MTKNTMPHIATYFAALGLLAAPFSVSAQNPQTGAVEDQLPAEASGNALNIPENVTLLAPNNPNVRTATAVVNGQVITGTDIDQRMALVLAASSSQPGAQELQMLRMQVLRNLIDETLQIQAAQSQEIEVSSGEIDQTYSRVASQNFGQDLAAMDKYLRSVGSSPVSLKRQIQGEIAWQRLLGRNVTPFVSVSEEEVNELLKRLEESRGTQEYRVGEIFLSSTPETHNAVGENARRIMQQLQQGGSFAAYARQFSEASTASVGGDLGWVRLGQMPAELSTSLTQMQAGQLVGPIEVPGGFSIIYLIDQRQVLMADPRDALLSLKQISITFPQGTTEAQASQKVADFSKGVQAIRGCGDADRAAADIGASIVSNDQIHVRSLPEQLQNVLLQMQIGQSTPPFGSVDEGVRVLMLCGRDDPKATGGPDFDTLMAQLEDERVNKRAQRYLRDLRNDAIIDYN
ncbi:MAG: peptidylprolyl isomerase [Sphingomonadaceae bacterium]